MGLGRPGGGEASAVIMVVGHTPPDTSDTATTHCAGIYPVCFDGSRPPCLDGWNPDVQRGNCIGERFGARLSMSYFPFPALHSTLPTPLFSFVCPSCGLCHS